MKFLEIKFTLMYFLSVTVPFHACYLTLKNITWLTQMTMSQDNDDDDDDDDEILVFNADVVAFGRRLKPRC